MKRSRSLIEQINQSIKLKSFSKVLSHLLYLLPIKIASIISSKAPKLMNATYIRHDQCLSAFISEVTFHNLIVSEEAIANALVTYTYP